MPPTIPNSPRRASRLITSCFAGNDAELMQQPVAIDQVPSLHEFSIRHADDGHRWDINPLARGGDASKLPEMSALASKMSNDLVAVREKVNYLESDVRERRTVSLDFLSEVFNAHAAAGLTGADHIVIDEVRSDQFIHKVEISSDENLVEHSAHYDFVFLCRHAMFSLLVLYYAPLRNIRPGPAQDHIFSSIRVGGMFLLRLIWRNKVFLV